MDNWIEECIAVYQRERHHLSSFLLSVQQFFAEHPELSAHPHPVLHSWRSRLKDADHLREKLRRKAAAGKPVLPDELLKQITDLAGLRLLHLYQAQFGKIHTVIQEQLHRGDWVLYEEPVAYTWDPESKVFFEQFGLHTELKESFYTSIHYTIKPRSNSSLTCEIQVRTLFEEAWGEIDHTINYPKQSQIQVCREQLRVLSRLVGAATQLTDSIFRAQHALSIGEGASDR